MNAQTIPWLAARTGTAVGEYRPAGGASKPAAAVAVNGEVVAGIDLLRGVLAILVVIAHALTYAFAAFPKHGSLQAFSPLLRVTVGEGAFSVRGFFVVSGFCINLSVLNALANGTYSIRGYALARLSRIYPMFLLGLGAAAGAWWLDNRLLPGQTGVANVFDLPAFVAEIFMVQGFFHMFTYYGITWSLTSEALYYAIWPGAIKLFGGARARTAIYATLGTLAFSLSVVAVWKVCAGGAAGSWLVPFWSVPAGAPLWLAGTLLAAYWNRWVQSSRLLRLRHLVWILVPAAYALQAYMGYLAARAWLNILQQYACIPAYMLMILWFHSWKGSALLRASVCRFLGELSYPVYLLHYPVLALAGSLLKHFHVTAEPGIAFVLVTAASLAVGALAGVPLERAIMRWRRGLLRRSGLKNPVDRLLGPAHLAPVMPSTPLATQV